MTRKLCLNIGCGWKKTPDNNSENWVNIDKALEVKPDLIMDLDKHKLPHQDSTVDYIYCVQTFEHFKDPLAILKDWWRVCKPGGKIFIQVPYAYAYQDHLHHRTVGFHEDTFVKFYPNQLEKHDRDYYSEITLELSHYKCYSGGLFKYVPFKKYMSKIFNNIYCYIEYELIVIK